MSRKWVFGESLASPSSHRGQWHTQNGILERDLISLMSADRTCHARRHRRKRLSGKHSTARVRGTARKLQHNLDCGM